jgi:hypothetical protein
VYAYTVEMSISMKPRANVVLQARDVGRLAGLTENAVKQWTIGRPYKIRPSVRHSTGKGIPNLYSLTDALRFAVAIELTSDGFQSRVIQRVLDSFDPSANTLLIMRDRIAFSLQSVLRCATEEARYRKDRDFVNLSFYLLDMRAIRESQNEQVARIIMK